MSEELEFNTDMNSFIHSFHLAPDCRYNVASSLKLLGLFPPQLRTPPLGTPPPPPMIDCSLELSTSPLSAFVKVFLSQHQQMQLRYLGKLLSHFVSQLPHNANMYILNKYSV